MTERKMLESVSSRVLGAGMAVENEADVAMMGHGSSVYVRVCAKPYRSHAFEVPASMSCCQKGDVSCADNRKTGWETRENDIIDMAKPSPEVHRHSHSLLICMSIDLGP
jgi:hypothetical protein